MISNKNQANRARLYAASLAFLGVDASPKDQAPDDYGCADSVSSILLMCFGPVIKYSVSTAEMFNFLNTSPDFVRTKTPSFGDIIISPTGKGKSAAMPNGHVGIVGEGEEIMSNSSATGLWTNNFTITSWVARYRDKGGYPIYFFRKV